MPFGVMPAKNRVKFSLDTPTNAANLPIKCFGSQKAHIALKLQGAHCAPSQHSQVIYLQRRQY